MIIKLNNRKYVIDEVEKLNSKEYYITVLIDGKFYERFYTDNDKTMWDYFTETERNYKNGKI